MSESAYKIANLLRDKDDGASLRTLMNDVARFLEEAPQAPVVPLEGANGEDEVEVELNLVAGVFEPIESSAEGRRSDGVLLPTAENHSQLQREQAVQAQRLLDLMSALSPSGSSGPTRNPVEELHQAPGMNENSDDEEVVVMDGTELGEETSSDDEPPAVRRVVELN